MEEWNRIAAKARSLVIEYTTQNMPAEAAIN
jgi:hypothetical protein